MDSSHRANVLVTSCFKTPVNPRTKVPLALYERARADPLITDGEQVESDSELDSVIVDAHVKDCSFLPMTDCCEMGHVDLRELYLSNEEYYCKLEQLRSAHFRTMADLDPMCRKKLGLKGGEPLRNHHRACLLQHRQTHSTTGRKLRKAHSAHELRSTAYIDEVPNGQGDHVNQNIAKDLVSSPNKHIKNMWRGFRVDKTSPRKQQASLVALENRRGDCQASVEPSTTAKVQTSKNGRGRSKEEGWRPQVTEPKPFQMTIRETEHKRKGIRSRAEIERENEELRKELEELTECQRKFRASGVPAHVRLPLYEELRERDEERRRQFRAAERQHLVATQRPFSFLERERIKKEQKDLKMLLSTKEREEHKRRPFRAKPVPRAVKEAALGEHQKEEQLYREIKKEMRATEMLLSAAEPPSTLSKRLGERRARRDEQPADTRDRTCSQVPDFDTSYKRFQEQLANRREFRPLTACEPFKLYTANINPRTEGAKGQSQSAPRGLIVSLFPRTHSSLSGSCEYLPSKMTDAAEKRQEAVRKRLEQRRKAEQEEEKWKERQKQKERKLQKLIALRAQANDPHVALAQIRESKLKEFRKQGLQRRTEYQEEMREIQERLKNRPLLLERVTQTNAKKAAEKSYTDVLHAFGLSEAFINSKAPTQSKNQTADHLENADLEDYLTDDYPADYEDNEREVQDVLTGGTEERQHEDEGDREGDPHQDGDSSGSYGEDVDFDDYIDKDGDERDEECGDSHHSLHSSTSSDDGKRDTSPLTDGRRKEEEKSRHGGQESMSDEEKKGEEREEEKNKNKD